MNFLVVPCNKYPVHNENKSKLIDITSLINLNMLHAIIYIRALGGSLLLDDHDYMMVRCDIWSDAWRSGLFQL
jgi:hypothetical protein